MDGDSAGTMGMPAMAAGICGELANRDMAAALGVLMPSDLTGEPKATGPYEDELQRGVLPGLELVTEPLLLIALPLGVLAGVMNGEKPPPACQRWISKPWELQQLTETFLRYAASPTSSRADPFTDKA